MSKSAGRLNKIKYHFLPSRFAPSIMKLAMNICEEKEYSLNKNTNIILKKKKDSCQLLAKDRALSTFYAV